MPGYQNIEDLFTKIKNCDAADIARYFSEAINIFPTLTKAERQECTHSFYSWAEENKNPQKQKFYYAKFLVSLKIFAIFVLVENFRCNSYYVFLLSLSLSLSLSKKLRMCEVTLTFWRNAHLPRRKNSLDK